MSENSTKTVAEGSRYQCDACQFEVLVVQGCPCDTGDPVMFCCNEKMVYHHGDSE